MHCHFLLVQFALIHIRVVAEPFSNVRGSSSFYGNYLICVSSASLVLFVGHLKCPRYNAYANTLS